MSNVADMHWAADLSRLAVDLLVSGLDRGYREHEWDSLEEWSKFALAFLRGDDLARAGASARNVSLTASLTALRMQLPSMFPFHDDGIEFEWEFRVSLAVELLRATYRVFDLPSPKRVLGLLSACEALRLANDVFRRPQPVPGR